MHGLVALAVVRFGLTLSLGPEYDSNANRAEIIQGADNTSATPDLPIGSFLLRTTADGFLVWRAGPNILRLGGGVGGKVFFNPDVFDQDVLVFTGALEDRVRVARFLHLSVAGDYYDASQLDYGANRHRDFRNGSAVMRMHFVDPLGEVTLSGGYRGFQYKPDPYFDFDAGQGTVRAVTRAHFGEDHELDVAAIYHFERRFFGGFIEENNCKEGAPITDSCLAASTTTLRQDWWHEGGIELTYVGPLLVTLGWGAELNVSNSFGQSLLRQIITLKLSYRLPWNLYATAKGQLLVTKYLDPVLLDRAVNTMTFVSIEDENRNSFILDLERPIGDTGLAVDARYSVYTNEISPSPSSFLRQLVYLGLTYRLGAR